MPKNLVLVIDDDKSICSLVRMYLEKEDFVVVCAYAGDESLELINTLSPPPNLVLLDVMLPGADGWFVLREIRKKSSVPIIMLTAKGEIYDKVLGLELGADDYITKPFDPKELVARVKAVMRRTAPDDNQTITLENLSVSLATYKVIFEGQSLDMTPKEIELLFFLAWHPNKVYTREQLLESVWGYDYYGDSRTIDVHVKRLREKLPGAEAHGWQIKTVWGVGYKFEVR